MSRTLVLPASRIRRTLRRLAYEVVERNRGADTLVLFGILESGAPLADTLAHEIRQIAGADADALVAHPLDVTPFRDDVDASPPPAVPGDDVPGGDVDVTDRDVLLIDDVLFTGRTARAAIDAVVSLGRPRSIQLVVLVDRGHREYPIQPDYVGRLMQTKHRERVVVDTDADEDARFAVYVED
jgi:pyrimidine operon attenuation protein/uracil phosphoribosyltransferase